MRWAFGGLRPLFPTQAIVSIALASMADTMSFPTQAIASIALLCILVVFVSIDFRPELGPATDDLLGKH